MLLKLHYSVTVSILMLLGAGTASATSLPGGCGEDAAQYKVKTEKGMLLSVPVSGSSQLVVIHTLAGDDWNNPPIARIAVDGKWIGAVKGRSYFAVNVIPGSHTVCVSRQSSVRAEKDNVDVSKISVHSGQTVYLAFTLTRNPVDEAKTHPASQMLGYSSPDMTSKRHETVDTASLEEIMPDAAPAHLKGLPESISEAKQ